MTRACCLHATAAFSPRGRLNGTDFSCGFSWTPASCSAAPACCICPCCRHLWPYRTYELWRTQHAAGEGVWTAGPGTCQMMGSSSCLSPQRQDPFACHTIPTWIYSSLMRKPCHACIQNPHQMQAANDAVPPRGTIKLGAQAGLVRAGVLYMTIWGLAASTQARVGKDDKGSSSSKCSNDTTYGR